MSAEFIWGSCQYDNLATLYGMAKKYSLKEAVEKLEGEGFVIEYDLNQGMIDLLKDGLLGKIFDVWRSNAHDLWYALSMAEDLVFTHGLTIYGDMGSEDELESDHPIRQSLVALACTEFGLILDEEPFKHWDT